MIIASLTTKAGLPPGVLNILHGAKVSKCRHRSAALLRVNSLIAQWAAKIHQNRAFFSSRRVLYQTCVKPASYPHKICIRLHHRFIKFASDLHPSASSLRQPCIKPA
jgi:hypothetical protein